jgi:hypothetical protein
MVQRKEGAGEEKPPSNQATQTLDIEGHPGAAFLSFYYRQQGKHEYEHSYHSPIRDSICICTFLLLYQAPPVKVKLGKTPIGKTCKT